MTLRDERGTTNFRGRYTDPIRDVRTIESSTRVSALPGTRRSARGTCGSLPRPLQGVATWAKCDMIYRVGFHRLDRVKEKQRDRRRYLDHRVTEHDLAAIERAVLHGVGLGRLTEFV